MCEVVGRLDETIDGLAALEPDTLTDGELHDALVAVQRQRAKLGAIAAGLLSRWEHRGVWAGDGSRNAASRLARDTRTSLTSANLELRRARQLRTMPATVAAVAAGELSLDHVDLLGRAVRPWRDAVFADHESTLVAECAKLHFSQAVKLIAYWCQRADAAAAEERAERQREGAHVHASPTIDGDVVLSGVLDPVGGATFTAELARLEHEVYLADQHERNVRTAGQRRAAALVEMSRRSAAASITHRRPKPLFTVLLGEDSFAGLCELASGQVIAPGALGPWLSDADMETVLFDGPTTVISVSSRRNFTGALRRAIEVRDRHCQHPSGCDVSADRCDVDHIVPRARLGETSQFNGRLECPTHNRHEDKHDLGAMPHPARAVTRLDELRARLRWRYFHDDSTDDHAAG